MDYTELGLVPIISAQANSTPLGGSTLSESVISAMARAARSHVDLAQLWLAAGNYLARITGSEDACPVIGAAAGMAISVAACVAGTDPLHIRNLPDPGDLPNEIVLQKGHSISYGGASISQMISMGGGRPVEAGAVNSTTTGHIESVLSSRTAALVYVTSRTHAIHRNGVQLEEIVALGRSHGIPVIVDAAGESDLRHWISAGADLAIYSGPKMFGGPTSGFICGRMDLVEACRAQNNGIARPMKVGKENLMGLLQAIEEYEAVSELERGDAQYARMTRLAERLGDLEGVNITVRRDDSGRNIHRVLLELSPKLARMRAADLDRELREGAPAIYLRDFKIDSEQLEIDPRALSAEGEDVVVRRLVELLSADVSRVANEHPAL